MLSEMSTYHVTGKLQSSLPSLTYIKHKPDTSSTPSTPIHCTGEGREFWAWGRMKTLFSAYELDSWKSPGPWGQATTATWIPMAHTFTRKHIENHDPCCCWLEKGRELLLQQYWRLQAYSSECETNITMFCDNPSTPSHHTQNVAV